MARYEIGGVCVEMTSFAASRWNAAETTEHDLRSSLVHIPGSTGDRSYMRDGEVVIVQGLPTDRWISLRRATNARLEPALAAMLADSPANATD